MSPIDKIQIALSDPTADNLTEARIALDAVKGQLKQGEVLLAAFEAHHEDICDAAKHAVRDNTEQSK